MQLDKLIMKEVCEELPIGVFIVNEDKKICFWNKWLEENTYILAEAAIDKILEELIPGMDSKRFNWAIEGAIKNSIPQVMSNTLNEYLIPIRVDSTAYDNIQYMQQQIKIVPVHGGGKNFAAVMVSDVTDLVLQKQTLLKMAIRMEQDSYHDPLTGAYNRRYMWDWIDRNIHLADREKFFIGFCIFDLDHFKSINDSFGHDRGDLVLKQFWEILNNSKRRSSIIVRSGGEEFISLLPMSTLKDTISYACRIREIINSSSIAGFDNGKITASIGCAVWDPGFPCSPEDLLKQADNMLYTAKNSGRNCVMPEQSHDSNKSDG